MRRRILGTGALALVCLAPTRAGAAQASDSVSVEQIVAELGGSARAEVVELLDQAAGECAAEPDSWQRRLIAAVIARPVESYDTGYFDPYFGPNIRVVVRAMTEVMQRCRDARVEEWISTNLRRESSTNSYIQFATALAAFPRHYSLLRELTLDPDADPNHRVWVTEALVASRASAPVWTVGSGYVLALRDQYVFVGLPDDYVQKWLPALLASVDTREALAQALSSALRDAPANMGAPTIVRILGANVAAYDYRFSEETRTIVASALDGLAERLSELPDDVAQAVGDATAARADGLNHRGVRVRRSDLSILLVDIDGECHVSGPPRVVEAIEEAAPGFRAFSNRAMACGPARVQYGDLDGDGALDALVPGLGGGPVVILGGDALRVFRLENRSGDLSVLGSPGPYQHSCIFRETFTYPNHYIRIGPEHVVFDGEAFARFTRSPSCD